MKDDGLDWAYKELGKKLASGRKREEPRSIPEIGTVFLVNPQMRATIDDIIAERLWPAVLEGLEGEGIDVYKRGEAVKSVRDKYWPEITRELVFLLEDPIRPLGPSNESLWYIRGKLEAAPLSYMLSFDLILKLPKSFEILRLILLMEEPRLSGMSPTLSVDRDYYAVTFSWGRGGPYEDPALEPATFVTGKICEHLDIIRAADALQIEIDNEGLFQELSNKIVAAYGEPEDLRLD